MADQIKSLSLIREEVNKIRSIVDKPLHSSGSFNDLQNMVKDVVSKFDELRLFVENIDGRLKILEGTTAETVIKIPIEGKPVEPTPTTPEVPVDPKLIEVTPEPLKPTETVRLIYPQDCPTWLKPIDSISGFGDVTMQFLMDNYKTEAELKAALVSGSVKLGATLITKLRIHYSI